MATRQSQDAVRNKRKFDSSNYLALFLTALLFIACGSESIYPIESTQHAVSAWTCGSCPYHHVPTNVTCLSVCGSCPSVASPPNARYCEPWSGHIGASPDVVKITSGSVGSTHVCWDANVDWSQVFVSVDGGAETLFAMEHKYGCADANWISAGHSVEFRLYGAKEHNEILARRTVRGIQAATLTASPNPVIIPDGSTTSSYTLSWNAPGYSQVDVWGMQNLVNPGVKIFLGTASGSGAASEPMSAGEVATIWLYPHGDTTNVLATVNVSGMYRTIPPKCTSGCP